MESDLPADNKPDSRAFTKGTQVSHYVVLERVCVCEKCEVYLAEDTELGRKVTLNFLPLQNSSNDETVAMFRSEVQAIASLNHSNIIRIYELGEYKGWPFAAMEFLHGRSVRDIIQKETHSLRQLLDVAVQICRGLTVAHEAGIVLHDLRPGNILIDAEDRVRLLGFRSAGSECVITAGRIGSEPGMTRYMSEEPLQGAQIDYHSNILSLGIIMYWMLTGRHPFRREREAESIQKKTSETLPLAFDKENLSDRLQRIIERALDRNPETRYRQANELLADLEREYSAQAMRESEGRFRDLADLLPQTVFELDMKANFTYTNRYGFEASGYTQKDLACGVNALDMFVPEDRERAEQNISKILNGEELEAHEYTVLRKDGSTYPALIYTRPIIRDGEPEGLRGIVVDISDLKQAEEALQKAHDELERRIEERTVELMEANKKLTKQMEDLRRAEEALLDSERRYRFLIDNAGYPIMVFSSDGQVLLTNSISARNLGGTPEDLIGKCLYDLLPGLADVIKERTRRVVETGEGLEAEDMVELPTGNRWFWSNMQPARDADDNIIGIQVISHDITDRKQAEEDLRTTHERLNATLNALPDLLFELDHEGRILDFRAPQPELLYRQPEEFLGKKMDQVLPNEAADTINASLEKARKLGKDSGAVYSLELGEEVCWFEFSVAASGDPKDSNTRFVALVRNITERKRRQDELKKKTNELRKEQKRLRDKNIALSQVLDQIESSRQEYQRQLYRDVDTALAPLLRKLKKEAGSDRGKEFEELEATLNSILAKDIDEFKIRYGRLTARESEICGMIKNGMTSKEISDDLNLSLLTVLKHREQIRKKLGITNKRISLVTYLRMH